MATVATRLLTAEEFYEWANRPENRDRRCELERGEIVEMSRPGKRHGMVCCNTAGILRNHAIRRKKGYICSNDTGVIVKRDPDTVRGPDILYFEDATEVEEVETGFGESPALLALEVFSPQDTPGKVMRRVQDQLRFGTQLVWVVDPEARNVTAYQAGQEPKVFEIGMELTGGDVLPEFRCAVAELFALPGQ